MKTQRLLVITVLVALLLAVPATAQARKNVWKARLTTGAELHEVVGSTASGSAVFGTNPNGSIRFQMQVMNLSGPVNGAHIHGPADETQNAPVLITLCGNPTPGVVATCELVDGILRVEGSISSSLLASTGVTGRQFFEYLDAGMLYVNVHTALNPAGEVRGQIY